jgi:hypothetical protein
MSIAEMSATLRREILARLKEQYAQSAKGRGDDARLASFIDYTSTNRIRADTDTKEGMHESIMSRGAFQSLANELNAILATSALSNIASKSLSSDVTFEEFRQYLISTVKLDLGTRASRTAGEYTYSGASRVGTSSGLTIATDTTEENSDRDVLILRNIPIGNLVTYYSNFLATKLELTSGSSLSEATKQLKSLFNAGHLTGAFNARLVRALGLRKNPAGSVVFDSGKHDSLASEAESEINRIMALVTDADYLSSNLVNNLDLFVTTDKRLYKNKVALRLTTEVQFASTNKEAGNILSQAGHAISDLTKAVKAGVSEAGQEAAVQKALTRLYTNLDKLALEVRRKAEAYKALGPKLRKEAQDNLSRILENTSAIEKIISSPGSRSIPDHIGYLVASVLKSTESNVESSKASISGNLLSSTTSRAKPAKVVLPKPKVRTKATKLSAIKSRTQVPPNLASLATLINSRLAEQIHANMGSGYSTNILNYRSGRLAGSANVTRMSLSKEGMITAFYTYMRNPYGTFSEGGAQSTPRSRDPKKLITKSIKDIASELVANRMRAVLV